jgi:hypothetical protein
MALPRKRANRARTEWPALHPTSEEVRGWNRQRGGRDFNGARDTAAATPWPPLR